MKNKNILQLILLRVLIFIFIQSILNSSLSFADVKEDRELLDKVSIRLLSRLISNPDGYKWPPKFEIIDSDTLNAYADFIDPYNPEEGFVIKIYIPLFEKIIMGSSDALAFILAHELSHITCGHLEKMYGKINKNEELFTLIYSREFEEEADIEGMKLALSSGFSKNKMVDAIKKIREVVGDYSPIEAHSSDHPSWTERLTYLDSVKSTLWQSMSAFENGVYLLNFENYETAAVCFKKVLQEYPDCFEAYSNLGYAYLMQYFDAFDLYDLSKFNIGYIVSGAFYNRPASLEVKTKGIRSELWLDAIVNLEKALTFESQYSYKFALVRANLGLAYLLNPDMNTLGRSKKYFDEALKFIEADKSLDPLVKAVIYLNAGVENMADSSYAEALKNLKNADTYLNEQLRASSNTEFFGSERNPSAKLNAVKYNLNTVKKAIEFNKILIKYKNLNEKNEYVNYIDSLLDFLRSSDPASIWWHFAYDLYSKNCNKIGEIPLSKDSLIETITIRMVPIQSIKLDNNVILISQKVAEVIAKLGSPEVIPVVEESKIKRYLFPKYHCEILGTKDVLGIILTEGCLERLDTKVYGEIYVGMDISNLSKLLDEEEPENFNIPGKDLQYTFFRKLGFAIQIEGNRVKEIFITQKPQINNNYYN